MHKDSRLHLAGQPPRGVCAIATKKTFYLIINEDMAVRAVQNLRLNKREFAIKVNLTFPDSWSQPIGEINIDLPELPPPDYEFDLFNQEENGQAQQHSSQGQDDGR